jgi:hypothetical protein
MRTARRCIANAGRLLFEHFAEALFRSARRIQCAFSPRAAAEGRASIGAAACKASEME